MLVVAVTARPAGPRAACQDCVSPRVPDGDSAQPLQTDLWGLTILTAPRSWQACSPAAAAAYHQCCVADRLAAVLVRMGGHDAHYRAQHCSTATTADSPLLVCCHVSRGVSMQVCKTLIPRDTSHRPVSEFTTMVMFDLTAQDWSTLAAEQQAHAAQRSIQQWCGADSAQTQWSRRSLARAQSSAAEP